MVNIRDVLFTMMAAVLNREAVFSPDYIPNTVTPSLQERETIWEAQTEIKRILKRQVRIIDRAVPCTGWNVSYFARKDNLMGICVCVKRETLDIAVLTTHRYSIGCHLSAYSRSESSRPNYKARKVQIMRSASAGLAIEPCYSLVLCHCHFWNLVQYILTRD